MKSKIKIGLAREFRKLPTRSEKMFWEKLRRNNFNGLYFRRQHIVDGYIIDFYCSELKLAIEIDGDVHQAKVKEDEERQNIIENRGIVFFRISSKEVESNIEEVIILLKNFLNSLPHEERVGEG